MIEKNKKKYKYLNYVEHLLTLALTVTGCVSISAFVLLVAIPAEIKICAVTAGIKKYF